jgi:hypothetical protein
LSIGEAVEAAFEAAASESKQLADTALILRRHIERAHNSSEEMPWPPFASYLHSKAVSPPDSLTNCLALVFFLVNQPHDAVRKLPGLASLWLKTFAVQPLMVGGKCLSIFFLA